jgi:hypothetical protein
MVFLFLLFPLISTPKGGLWKRIHRNLRVTEIPTPHRGRSRSDLVTSFHIASLLASPMGIIVVEARDKRRDLLCRYPY